MPVRLFRDPGGEEQLFYFARNLHDHVVAAANIGSAGALWLLYRIVHRSGLTPSQVRTLREYARAAGLRVLPEVNWRARERTGANQPTDARESGRINSEVYVFDEIGRPVVSVVSCVGAS